jgi:hypothetical protein
VRSPLHPGVQEERYEERNSTNENRNGDRRIEQPCRERQRRSADHGIQDRDHAGDREIELPARRLADAYIREHAVDVIVAFEEEVPGLRSRELQIEAADAVDRTPVEEVLEVCTSRMKVNRPSR